MTNQLLCKTYSALILRLIPESGFSAANESYIQTPIFYDSN